MNSGECHCLSASHGQLHSLLCYWPRIHQSKFTKVELANKDYTNSPVTMPTCWLIVNKKKISNRNDEMMQMLVISPPRKAQMFPFFFCSFPFFPCLLVITLLHTSNNNNSPGWISIHPCRQTVFFSVFYSCLFLHIPLLKAHGTWSIGGLLIIQIRESNLHLVQFIKC